MTARGTDWTLAGLVAIGFATGGLTLYAGAHSEAWVFVTHGVAGFALVGVLVWKLRRVAPRLRHAALRDRYSMLGITALAMVAATIATGAGWSTGWAPSPLGYSLLSWHDALGIALMMAMAVHASTRVHLPTRGNPSGRRDFLRVGAVGATAYVAWRLQPALGAKRRRFTGSYEADSFAGNSFPTTSWVADDPKPVERAGWRLSLDGLVQRRLALSVSELGHGDELIATLDCTGGFYSTQRWRGASLAHLIARAQPLPAASHVRVVSRTGYRWTFTLDDARKLLLATQVGGQPLTHDHGAPARLVAPGRRGFEWVKWVDRIELTAGPDPGAMLSTLWSSFTPAGRGA